MGALSLDGPRRAATLDHACRGPGASCPKAPVQLGRIGPASAPNGHARRSRARASRSPVAGPSPVDLGRALAEAGRAAGPRRAGRQRPARGRPPGQVDGGATGRALDHQAVAARLADDRGRHPRRCVAPVDLARSPPGRPPARTGWASRRTATGWSAPSGDRTVAPTSPASGHLGQGQARGRRRRCRARPAPGVGDQVAHRGRTRRRGRPGRGPAVPRPCAPAARPSASRTACRARRAPPRCVPSTSPRRRRHGQPVDHADHRHDRGGVDVPPPALVVEADVAAHDRQARAPGRRRPCRRWPRRAATWPRGARGCRS